MIGLTLDPWVIYLHDGDRAFVRAEVPIIQGAAEITIELDMLFKKSQLKRATAIVIAKGDGTKRIYPMSGGFLEPRFNPKNLVGE